MRERPILFSAPMVRAILEGRKTQTRRVVKPVRGYEHNNVCRPDMAAEDYEVWWHGESDRVGCLQSCPYGVPGDRLWVRESHWRFTGCAPAWEGFVPSPDGDPYNARCYDDYPNLQGMKDACAGVRVPSIYIPRWASRITLEVTGVRVERLQGISEEDAMAEGAPPILVPPDGGSEPHVEGFRDIWESINGPGSWDANPWVWVIDFRAAGGE